MSCYIKSPFETDPSEIIVDSNSSAVIPQLILNSSQTPQNEVSNTFNNSIENGNVFIGLKTLVTQEVNELTPDQFTNPEKEKQNLFYGIEDIPSWYLTIFLGFQHYLLMAGVTVTKPLLLMPAMCMQKDDPDMGNIISTFLFLSGIITILQTTFGSRLPIIQGGSFVFVITALAFLNTDPWKCPSEDFISSLPQANRTILWQERMREIQGAIIVASFFQIALGFFGVFGFIMHRITPITLASAIIVNGLSLFEVGSSLSSVCWPISISTMILVIVFSQYLRDFKIPIPFTRSKKRNGRLRYPMFQLFPVLLSVTVVWMMCAILTATGAFPDNYAARTSAKINITRNAEWFRVPYPFQWGRPTISLGAVIGFLSAVVAGIIESIGEYQGAVRILRVPNLAQHAVNRGIFIEGVGCLLAGIFGTGNGTTSYSQNTAAISITKVGSRRVFQISGFIMMVVSTVGKLGAFFVAIPDPIIGGVVSTTFSVIIATGLSNLQNVNLISSRNMFIIAFSVFFSLGTSKWVANNGAEIDFGHEELNFILKILFRSSMFIAATISFILDNTIPGTPEDGGIALNPVLNENSKTEETKISELEGIQGIYDLPFGMKSLRRKFIMSWLPISPTFKGSNYSAFFNKRTKLSE